MFEVERNQDRQADPALKHYLRTIGRHPLLTRQEEAELARRVRLGDQEALDRLINGNLRFVVSVAKQFLGRGLGLMDLIAEGNVGLITAARRFDERREFRFVTYAVWWVRQSIQAALQEQTRTVRLPSNRAREAGRITRAERALEQRRLGAVADDELAEILAMDPANVARIRAASRANVPLDETPGDGRATLAETLADGGREPAPERVEREALEAALAEALAALDPRERQIIERYYGLGGTGGVSLEEIGASLRLSRERVRQLRNRAFARIRQGARGPLLAEFLG
ncbi:MAG: sigma-70 family RNA polymerase sigma factor [Krumholzibacteria bacterium]|nr:sigma-70 family RNA polymerase sigma factor [Candidatus Krumholzibacteria bacterium]